MEHLQNRTDANHPTNPSIQGLRFGVLIPCFEIFEGLETTNVNMDDDGIWSVDDVSPEKEIVNANIVVDEIDKDLK